VRIERLPLQPGDVPITYADVSRAQRELGYQPRMEVEEGVRLFVEWFKQRHQLK
jgi:nucleoside-diphosphate-sugar epimerase